MLAEITLDILDVKLISFSQSYHAEDSFPITSNFFVQAITEWKERTNRNSSPPASPFWCKMRFQWKSNLNRNEEYSPCTALSPVMIFRLKCMNVIQSMSISRAEVRGSHWLLQGRQERRCYAHALLVGEHAAKTRLRVC